MVDEGTDRLQTGMRGAWGKPYGTVARVNIGQVILSIRCKDANAPVVMEALRRARYKFPGRQKIIISKKWGFTSVAKGDYMKLKEDKMVIQYVNLFVGEAAVLIGIQGRCIRAVYPPEGPAGAEPSHPTPRMIACIVYVCELYTMCEI